MRYLKPYLKYSILSVLLAIAASATSAAPAWLIKYVIDNVLVDKDYRMLMMICGGIIGVYILKGVFFYVRGYVSEMIAGKIIYDVRKDMYGNLQNMSFDFFSRNKTGEIMSIFSNDVNKFQEFISTTFSFFVKFFTMIMLLITVFYKNWQLAILAVFFVPLLSKIVRTLSKKLYKTGRAIQEKLGHITVFLQETISGIRVIKAFATEEDEIRKFDEENTMNFKITMKNKKMQVIMTPITDFFNAISIAIILWFGGKMVIEGKMTSGDFFSFLTALALLYEPLKELTKMMNDRAVAASAVERIFWLLDEKTTIKEKEGAIDIFSVSGEIKFENVNFKYPDNDKLILKNINLKAESGKVIALVGKSGGGKSTLVNLIPRFYDVLEGKITIDGKDIRDIKIKSLRKIIGIVSQDVFLFNGTIYSNIIYGTENASKEEVEKAVKMANVSEFSEKLPKGLETEVGERGVMLSGGQKQRIAIARAILRNPKILILDEATSALDTESEKLVQDAIYNLMQERTTFIIAHRLSTILKADKIVVIQDGEIKEFGTNSQLLEKNGIYKRLYDRQFED